MVTVDLKHIPSSFRIRHRRQKCFTLTRFKPHGHPFQECCSTYVTPSYCWKTELHFR